MKWHFNGIPQFYLLVFECFPILIKEKCLFKKLLHSNCCILCVYIYKYKYKQNNDELQWTNEHTSL